jgi:hypothetical protein
VIFVDNTFDDLQGPGLFLSNANTVVVAHNRFINTNLSRLRNETVGDANLGGSIVVANAQRRYPGQFDGGRWPRLDRHRLDRRHKAQTALSLRRGAP